MNAKTINLNIKTQLPDLEHAKEALSILAHTIILHRTTGHFKFNVDPKTGDVEFSITSFGLIEDSSNFFRLGIFKDLYQNRGEDENDHDSDDDSETFHNQNFQPHSQHQHHHHQNNNNNHPPHSFNQFQYHDHHQPPNQHNFPNNQGDNNFYRQDTITNDNLHQNFDNMHLNSQPASNLSSNQTVAHQDEHDFSQFKEGLVQIFLEA